jgi:hypothetical protein
MLDRPLPSKERDHMRDSRKVDHSARAAIAASLQSDMLMAHWRAAENGWKSETRLREPHTF